MSTDLNASFNEQYMNINTKLKKRFMRKPNISEATNEFIALAIQCEHSEQPSFAGQTYIGAAKCEASAGNFLGEAELYIAASRQFMMAEKKFAALKLCSPNRENLEAAIGCYMHALSKYPEGSPMRISILMELSNELVATNHKLEAVEYCKQALGLITDSTMRLMLVRNLINMYINCGEHNDALKLANEICEWMSNIPEGILAELQVTRILLSLVVEPDEDNRTESLKQLIDEVMSDNDSDMIPFNVDLRLKLQSLVMSSLIADHTAVIVAALDVIPFLSTEQKDLLGNITTKHQTRDAYNLFFN